SGIFIDQVWVEHVGLLIVKLDVSIPVYNIDSMLNAGGYITHKCSFVVVEYQGHRERVTTEATQLGEINLIVGWTWLLKHDPEINWQTEVVTLS
ncbi:hypothetical protein SERLA73DRAFT_28151, partial [Serpula lacrymans var. lacrymans S7.3]